MASSTDLNKLMKFYQMLLSGDLGMFTGAVDPLAMAREQMAHQPQTPLTDSYLSSTNEDIKGIFSGLVAGQLDPISAKQQLIAAFPDDYDLASSLTSSVDAVMKEQAATKKSRKPTSAAAKGYMPEVTESYVSSPEMAPLLPKAQKAVAGIDQRLQMLKTALPPARGTVSGKAKEQTGFSNVDPELGGLVQKLDPMGRDMLFKELRRRMAKDEQAKQKIIAQNAQTLEQAGRTPFTDMLGQLAALLSKMLGQ